MAQVKVLKIFSYNGRRMRVGEVFVASDKNARILKALRKVEDCPPAPAPVARHDASKPASAVPKPAPDADADAEAPKPASDDDAAPKSAKSKPKSKPEPEQTRAYQRRDMQAEE